MLVAGEALFCLLAFYYHPLAVSTLRSVRVVQEVPKGWNLGGSERPDEAVYSGASKIRQLNVLSLKRRDQCGEVLYPFNDRVALYNLSTFNAGRERADNHSFCSMPLVRALVISLGH